MPLKLKFSPRRNTLIFVSFTLPEWIVKPAGIVPSGIKGNRSSIFNSSASIFIICLSSLTLALALTLEPKVFALTVAWIFEWLISASAFKTSTFIFCSSVFTSSVASFNCTEKSAVVSKSKLRFFTSAVILLFSISAFTFALSILMLASNFDSPPPVVFMSLKFHVPSALFLTLPSTFVIFISSIADSGLLYKFNNLKFMFAVSAFAMSSEFLS